MKLSSYHQKYFDQSDAEIQSKADAKAEELAVIFQKIALATDSNQVRVAILGCGDQRFIAHHQRIFAQTLKKEVEVNTFDITIDHLAGGPNVFRHDCTLPLPHPPYDITYAHVLMKFIATEKQFDLLQNSFTALLPGGVAIHVLDQEEINAAGPSLADGLWAVPLTQWKHKLTEHGIEYQEIPIKYGLALILLRH